MPLTEKGQKIMSSMKSEYGEKKGKQVFYASKNAGKIRGVDQTPHGGMKRNRHFGSSVADEVRHTTFINKSGNRENKTG